MSISYSYHSVSLLSDLTSSYAWRIESLSTAVAILCWNEWNEKKTNYFDMLNATNAKRKATLSLNIWYEYICLKSVECGMYNLS